MISFPIQLLIGLKGGGVSSLNTLLYTSRYEYIQYSCLLKQGVVNVYKKYCGK